jgi:two-component system CheB/CheR fusion protein
VDQIRQALRQAMSGGDGSRSTTVEATNRRGRRVRCRVTCSPLVGSDKSARGVIVVVEPQPDSELQGSGSSG